MRFTTTISLVLLLTTWMVASHLAQSDAFPGRENGSGKYEW